MKKNIVLIVMLFFVSNGMVRAEGVSSAIEKNLLELMPTSSQTSTDQLVTRQVPIKPIPQKFFERLEAYKQKKEKAQWIQEETVKKVREAQLQRERRQQEEARDERKNIREKQAKTAQLTAYVKDYLAQQKGGSAKTMVGNDKKPAVSSLLPATPVPAIQEFYAQHQELKNNVEKERVRTSDLQAKYDKQQNMLVSVLDRLDRYAKLDAVLNTLNVNNVVEIYKSLGKIK